TKAVAIFSEDRVDCWTSCRRVASLGIPEVNKDAVAHVLRYEPAEALHSLGDALLVARDDLAQIVSEGRRSGTGQSLWKVLGRYTMSFATSPKRSSTPGIDPRLINGAPGIGERTMPNRAKWMIYGAN